VKPSCVCSRRAANFRCDHAIVWELHVGAHGHLIGVVRSLPHLESYIRKVLLGDHLENRLIPMITSAAITFVASVLAHRVVEAKFPGSISTLNTFPDLSACVSEPSFFSCENTTAIKNTCCSPTPGGLVLQTQFWDTWTGLEKRGQKLPKGSWTIHGLWPDNCDGYATYLEIQDQVSIFEQLLRAILRFFSSIWSYSITGGSTKWNHDSSLHWTRGWHIYSGLWETRLVRLQ